MSIESRKSKRRPKGRMKLPPYVAAVIRKGSVGYRAWMPGGRNGKKVWSRVVEDPQLAYQLGQEMRRLDLELPQNLTTFGQAIMLVEERLERDRRRGSVEWFRSQKKELEQFFGEHTPVEKIRARDIEAFRDKRLRRVSAATVGHHRRALSLIFNGAVKKRLLRSSPMDEVDGWPRVEAKEMSFLTADEVAEIVDRVRSSESVDAGPDADLIALLYLTGLRRGELGRMRVEDLQLDKGFAWVTGKARNERLALGAEAVELLRRMAGHVSGSGPLVPGGDCEVSRILSKWKRSLKEPRLSAHALRHSFVSALVDAGHDMGTVQKLARHRSIQMTARYFHTVKDASELLSSLSVKRPGGDG